MNQQRVNQYISYHDISKAFLVTLYPISYFKFIEWKLEMKSLFSAKIREVLSVVFFLSYTWSESTSELVCCPKLESLCVGISGY